MTTLYVSGGMSGHHDLNYEAFEDAALNLRFVGYVVLNPAENFGGSHHIPREQCMRLDIQQVLMSDGIAVLDGWESSPGARLEVEIAKQIGLRVMGVDNWIYEIEEKE